MRAVRDLIDLSGRAALVTGACGHIGSAIADALSEVGASIVVLDLDVERCESAASDIRARSGVDAMACPLDLEDAASLAAVPHRVVEALGRLDVLVHAAALVGTYPLPGWVDTVEQQDLSTWRRAIEVNLSAVFALTQAAIPILRESGHGSVVNIASIYGVVGPDWSLYDGTELGSPAAYAASKGGLLQLTRWFATTLAPAIRVNAISPGGIFRDTPEPFLSRYVERTPMRRMGTEEDIKGAAVFLASDLSAYVTGQNLMVDGGWTSW